MDGVQPGARGGLDNIVVHMSSSSFLFQVNVERVQRTHTESHSMEEEKKRKVMREKRVLGRQSIGYS